MPRPQPSQPQLQQQPPQQQQPHQLQLLAPTETIPIPLRQAQLLYESLYRASEAARHCRLAAENFASQFGSEQEILERARLGLQQILRQSGGLPPQ